MAQKKKPMRPKPKSFTLKEKLPFNILSHDYRSLLLFFIAFIYLYIFFCFFFFFYLSLLVNSRLNFPLIAKIPINFLFFLPLNGCCCWCFLFFLSQIDQNEIYSRFEPSKTFQFSKSDIVVIFFFSFIFSARFKWNDSISYHFYCSHQCEITCDLKLCGTTMNEEIN